MEEKNAKIEYAFNKFMRALLDAGTEENFFKTLKAQTKCVKILESLYDEAWKAGFEEGTKPLKISSN